MVDREALRMGAEHFGVRLSSRQLDQFVCFADILYEWNERLNLTRVPRDRVVQRHFLDSLSVCRAVCVAPACLLDVGTGAGFPGIPLSIVWPDCQCTLMDGTAKKLVFVNEVIAALGLANCRTVHGRAEDQSVRGALGGRYQVVVARAVAPSEKLVELVAPYVSREGVAVLLKSGSAGQELADAAAAVSAAGLVCDHVERCCIPGESTERLCAVLKRAARAQDLHAPSRGRRPR